MLGSLKVVSSSPVPPVRSSTQPPLEERIRIIQSDEDVPMVLDPDFMSVTDKEGNIQVKLSFCISRHLSFEPHDLQQFVEAESPSQVLVDGCNFMRAISACYTAPSGYRGGEMHRMFSPLEVLRAHREAYAAFPTEHQQCINALTKVAFAIERSRSKDVQAAATLHNEAWMMKEWYNGFHPLGT